MESEMTEIVMPTYDKRHGGPYDRGSADSYYRRGFQPHYYPGATGVGARITGLTPEEVDAYRAGYDANEAAGHFKDWG